ncbi:hypothetical protein ES703_65789 [subsurface metagenome]
MPPGETHIPREATLVVAASNSLTPSADYVCDGVSHELIIDDCEVAWNSRQGANVVCTADVDHQVGTFSAKMAVQAAAGLGLLATHDFASLDLSDHHSIKVWIKHSLGCAAGDLALHLSSTADCGGAPDEEEIVLPYLAAVPVSMLKNELFENILFPAWIFTCASPTPVPLEAKN